MKKLVPMAILTAVVVIPALGSAQPPGQMVFEQGCVAYDLVEDLGSFPTPLGQEGRWLIRSLSDGSEVVYAFETIDLIPPPADDPFKFGGSTFVAWELEGTGVRGTNRTEFAGSVEEDFSFTGFFEGETFRGTKFKSGGISGTVAGVFGGEFAYGAVRIVLCKEGFGGPRRK